MKINSHINNAVIGGGTIGLCCALELQRQEKDVVIFEPNTPASGCSLGNAGHFATEQIIPLANLDTLKKLPMCLWSQNSPLSIKYSYLPALFPWLTRFVCASTPAKVRSGINALSQLNHQALPAWLSLLRNNGLESLLKTSGSYLVMESERSLHRYRKTLDTLEISGVPFDVLSSKEIDNRIPVLAGKMRNGLFFGGTAHTVNPYRLGESLAKKFTQRGGKIIPLAVKKITTLPTKETILETKSSRHLTRYAIVAAGAFSKNLVKQTGHSVPLDTERGYHIMLPRPKIDLAQPVTFFERQFIATPMEHGLRLAGFVEFGGLKLPSNTQLAWHLYQQSKELIPEISAEGAENWMGFRPTLPDYLPVIGSSPKNPRILYAFGHQHLGLTQAAITAKLIASLAKEERLELDLTPFRIDRFS